jgi:hypothetical protein
MNDRRTYKMRAVSRVGKEAAVDIARWLRSLPETVAVADVEDEPSWQEVDVDLLWIYQDANLDLRTVPIEVKGDRWDASGNFFFETISNQGRGSEGCFLYTEAEFVYYYFINSHRLFILPMPQTRDWFVRHLDDFREAETSTPAGDGDFYVTVGRLVPVDRVLREVPGVREVAVER